MLRTFEVAGSGHSTLVSALYRDPVTIRDFGELPFPADCDLPPFSHVPGYHVINKNYDHLTSWVRFGLAPPISPQLEFDESVDPPELVRDEFGIAVGSIRLAAVEVPIALNSGENAGSAFCVLFGTHQPFDDATIEGLYPRKGRYVSRVTQTALGNFRDGYIPLRNAIETLLEAVQADVPPSGD